MMTLTSISDTGPSTLASLRAAAKKRKSQAFSSGTTANHNAQFTLYFQFCLMHKLQDIDPSVDTLLLYTEYLAQRFQSHKSVHNYISGVRLLHKLLGVQAPALSSFDLALMLRATRMTMTIPSQPKLPITPALLLRLCSHTDTLGALGITVKCALVFGFFAFLRQSNLAPPSTHMFNPKKHTCRGDVILGVDGLTLIIKWTKNHPPGLPASSITPPSSPTLPSCLPSHCLPSHGEPPSHWAPQ